MMASTDEPAPAGSTASDLFAALWGGMTDMLGPTATAVLLRRSVNRVAARHPGVRDMAIVRRDFEYTYALPPSWTTGTPESLAAFRDIVRELWPLLQQLTGPVVVRRLQDVPLLARNDAIPKDLRQ